MKLSTENIVWIHHCAKTYNSEPAAFLNALLNYIKSSLGADPQNLQEWFQNNEILKKNLAEQLQKTEETRIVVEETTRAAKLYLSQIQNPKYLRQNSCKSSECSGSPNSDS